MEKLSIVIPAYNEERRIGRTLEAYTSFFEDLRKKKLVDYQIVVVVNNTTDNTAGVVLNNIKRNNKIVLMNLKKKGKGNAVIQGLKKSLEGEFDTIGFVDADMATSPEAYYDLVKKMGGFDAVIASRGLKNSVVKSSMFRRVQSRGFNWVVRSLTFLPFRDTQCGAKVFNRKGVEFITKHRVDSQWAFDVEVLYLLKKNGFRVRETPTVWEDKAGSSVKMMTPVKMFLSIVRLRILYSPIKPFVRVYNRLPEKLKIHKI